MRQRVKTKISHGFSGELRRFETQFTQLFIAAHGYLDRARELRDVWRPTSVIKQVQDYETILLDEIHLIRPLLEANPTLKDTFNFDRTASSFERAHKLYQSVLRKPHTKQDDDQICMFKVLWEAVDICKLLNDHLQKATRLSILDHALVAMCTAYECYAKDAFCSVLINIPSYAQRYVSTLSVPVKEMAKYHYNPLKQAGKIFTDREGQSFKIFENGKKLFRDVLDFDLFESSDSEDILWKIFQTRHCIIHNGGKPDSLWRLKTKHSKFSKNATTLKSYISILHNEFHWFYFRLYKHLFKKAPSSIKEELAGE